MVSSIRAETVRLRRAPIGLLVASLSVLSVAACSKSECLREDCATSAPSQPVGVGGASATAPSKGCTENAQCQTEKGQFCVDGTCRLACLSHFDCQGYGQCTSGSDSDGKAGHYCELGHAQKPGQFYTHCPSGTDAECDTDAGFLCIGAGADDLDAYCTTDCADDSACADGFTCSPLIRPPCQNDCGLTGTPKDRQCVPSDQIGPGKAYQCGSHGVTRNVCRPRKFCGSCQTDVDCLAAPSQICAKDQSGAKICTQSCDVLHPSCPWGNAAACGVWDHDLNVATCAHRFGQCTGTGKGCEPCQKDSDCGVSGACSSSSFTGERWCVDLAVSCSCGSQADANGLCTGGGCSKSPSGLPLLCLDSTPGTANSGVCVGANTESGLLAASAQQTGCWPPN